MTRIPVAPLMGDDSFPHVDFMSCLATDYIRAEMPSFGDCYRRSTVIAGYAAGKCPPRPGREPSSKVSHVAEVSRQPKPIAMPWYVHD